MLLNKERVIEEIKRDQQFQQINQDDNMTYQNSWDAAKPALVGMFIATDAYIKTLERHQINQCNAQQKQEQAKLVTSETEEINKFKVKEKPYKRSDT